MILKSLDLERSGTVQLTFATFSSQETLHFHSLLCKMFQLLGRSPKSGFNGRFIWQFVLFGGAGHAWGFNKAHQLQIIFPTLARWHWIYLGSTMLDPNTGLKMQFIRTKSVNFPGNPIFQATKQHLTVKWWKMRHRTTILISLGWTMLLSRTLPGRMFWFFVLFWSQQSRSLLPSLFHFILWCFIELEFAVSAACIQQNLHSPIYTCTMVPPKKVFCPCIICIYLYVQTPGFLATLAEKPAVWLGKMSSGESFWNALKFTGHCICSETILCFVSTLVEWLVFHWRVGKCEWIYVAVVPLIPL